MNHGLFRNFADFKLLVRGPIKVQWSGSVGSFHTVGNLHGEQPSRLKIKNLITYQYRSAAEFRLSLILQSWAKIT